MLEGLTLRNAMTCFPEHVSIMAGASVCNMPRISSCRSLYITFAQGHVTLRRFFLYIKCLSNVPYNKANNFIWCRT